MDSTPGLEVYESYEQDYRQLAQSISGKLKNEVKEGKGGGSQWEAGNGNGNGNGSMLMMVMAGPYLLARRTAQGGTAPRRNGARGGRRDCASDVNVDR